MSAPAVIIIRMVNHDTKARKTETMLMNENAQIGAMLDRARDKAWGHDVESIKISVPSRHGF